jgi:uncharacterized beta-barrel protein YwiB (DUF1934 family)
MEQAVVLSIVGRQAYADQEPDVVELVTEGIMLYRDGGWDIRYEESDLTGLTGVTTEFRVEEGEITLTRSGKMHSQMIFREGVAHDSLYQMEFGALMLTVCATRVEADITPQGGTIDLTYNIEIEHNAAGVIEYHLDIKTK